MNDRKEGMGYKGEGRKCKEIHLPLRPPTTSRDMLTYIVMVNIVNARNGY